LRSGLSKPLWITYVGEKLMERPDWTTYFFNILEVISTRSTCNRRQLGALIVKNKQIISTGYNGQLSGAQHCNDLGDCLRTKMNIPSGERDEICRAVHAEQNAISQAARYGLSLEGAIMFITNTPCVICAKIIAASGIKEIYVNKADYPAKLSMELLAEIDLPVYLVNNTGIVRINLPESNWRDMI